MQNPIVLGDHSAPQPDLCLLAPREDDYTGSHPQADDVLLAIEVADSSLAYDRDVKIALYARHGIPEVWLVDSRKRRVHCYRRLESGAHRDVSAPDALDALAPAALPDVPLDLSSLF